MTASSAAMIVSPPSSEKRFWPTYLVCRNFSKSSALWTRRRIRTCWAWEKLGLEPGRLDPLLKPSPAVPGPGCGRFHPDVPAVGLLERGHDVPQLHLAAAAVGSRCRRRCPDRPPNRSNWGELAASGSAAGHPRAGRRGPAGARSPDRPRSGSGRGDCLRAVDDRDPAGRFLSRFRSAKPVWPARVKPWKNARHVGSTASGLSSQGAVHRSMRSALALAVRFKGRHGWIDAPARNGPWAPGSGKGFEAETLDQLCADLKCGGGFGPKLQSRLQSVTDRLAPPMEAEIKDSLNLLLNSINKSDGRAVASRWAGWRTSWPGDGPASIPSSSTFWSGGATPRRSRSSAATRCPPAPARRRPARGADRVRRHDTDRRRAGPLPESLRRARRGGAAGRPPGPGAVGPARARPEPRPRRPDPRDREPGRKDRDRRRRASSGSAPPRRRSS